MIDDPMSHSPLIYYPNFIHFQYTGFEPKSSDWESIELIAFKLIGQNHHCPMSLLRQPKKEV